MSKFARFLLAVGVIAATLLLPQGAVATFPGDNGPIAYQAEIDQEFPPQTGIFLVEPGGTPSQAFPLTADFSASYPALDNDSKRIVYIGADPAPPVGESSEQIYVFDRSTGQSTKLTSSEDPNTQPSFSADGEWIVFVRTDQAGNGRIWKMRDDGSDEVNLSPPSQDSDTGPAFSPDGTEIAFLHFDQLYLMNADGTNARSIAADAQRFPDGRVDFSSDGETIAFESEGSGDGPDEIPGGLQVINVDGTERASLLPQYGTNSPSFSPDLKSIAYFYGGLSRRAVSPPPGGLIPASPGVNIGSLGTGESTLLADASEGAAHPYWGNEVVVPPVDPPVDPPVNPPVNPPVDPPACKLRVARARLFVYRKQNAIRLVARYRSQTGGTVQVKFYKATADGKKGRMLGSLKRKFDRRGKFRIRKALPASQIRSLRGPGPGFIAQLRLAKRKGYCDKPQTIRLNDLRRIKRQFVWFALP